MKLTIKEKQAISTFRAVLDAIEKGKPYEITTADQNAIKSVFGVDFKEITFKKSVVQEFVNGKDDFHLTFKKPFSDWSPANKVKSYGFFPFQIKSFFPKAKTTNSIQSEIEMKKKELFKLEEDDKLNPTYEKMSAISVLNGEIFELEKKLKSTPKK